MSSCTFEMDGVAHLTKSKLARQVGKHKLLAGVNPVPCYTYELVHSHSRLEVTGDQSFFVYVYLVALRCGI